MSTTTSAMNDREVQVAVQDELDWTPDVDAAGIGVAIEDGTVSLSGEVDSYAEKLAARRAALRVSGVVAVVDHLVVHPKSQSYTSDTDTAKLVAHALTWASSVPDSVQAEIDHHRVTLTGEVDWNYQRRAAERAVHHLEGVVSVRKLIRLSPRASAADAKSRIEKALERNAQLDAKAIQVEVTGDQVVLTGQVQSWAEKQQAGYAAWASPHVGHVDNRITIKPF